MRTGYIVALVIAAVAGVFFGFSALLAPIKHPLNPMIDFYREAEKNER